MMYEILTICLLCLGLGLIGLVFPLVGFLGIGIAVVVITQTITLDLELWFISFQIAILFVTSLLTLIGVLKKLGEA